MKKRIYQEPITEIIFLMDSQHLMAGSVRNDDHKIFEGSPDPDTVDEGDQNSHPADSKRWNFVGWED